MLVSYELDIYFRLFVKVGHLAWKTTGGGEMQTEYWIINNRY